MEPTIEKKTEHFEILLPESFSSDKVDVKFYRKTEKTRTQNIVTEKVSFVYNNKNNKYMSGVRLEGKIIRNKNFLKILNKNLPKYVKKHITELIA